MEISAMNILVTGSAGFLGNRLATRLATAGHTVYGLEHDRANGTSRYNVVKGSITEYARILEILVNFEIDQVYHCASKAIVRNCVADPVGCINTNVLGTAIVLEACRQWGGVSGVMCMESDKAYGPSSEAYSEDTPLRPVAIYEASKACVSHLVATYRNNFSLPVFGVRSANLYGPHDPNRSRLVPHSIDRLNNGQRPEIVDGAEYFVREFLFVDDASTAIVKLMDAEPWGQSINIGNESKMTIRDAISVICESFGADDNFDILPRKKNFTEIPHQSVLCGKMHELTGYRPPTSFSDGIRLTVDEEMA